MGLVRCVVTHIICIGMKKNFHALWSLMLVVARVSVCKIEMMNLTGSNYIWSFSSLNGNLNSWHQSKRLFIYKLQCHLEKFITD